MTQTRTEPRWGPGWRRWLGARLLDLPFRPMPEQQVIRRALARDPVAFALIYLRPHLKSKETGEVTFAEVHYEWARKALAWADGPPERPQEDRNAYVAPRECGKSTWWYLILPLWAAANGHVGFIAAFADSATQAEIHLKTFKHELDSNPLLQMDYPELCTPARKPSSGATVSDNAGMLIMRSGFVFAARGIDASSLGMKVGDRRPDLLIFDDVEPDEARYSAELVKKRLGTILDAIFPLNIRARVVMVGTTTMPGSIMHQLVKAAHGAEHDPWVDEQAIKAHHYRAIVTDDQGNERSLWPAKWPLDWLLSIRHSRMYAKNYDNDPMAREGVYWRKEDFRYGTVEALTRHVLVIDPAVTTKKTSDFTGLAVIGFSPRAKQVLIRKAYPVRLTGQHLRAHVIERVLVEYPEITHIIIETNQGGDLWPEVFHHIPNVKIRTHTATVAKEIRFADALTFWQRGQVMHERRLPALEEQGVAFPNGDYDDVIDAAVTGVLQFLKPEPKVRAGSTVSQYV